MLSLTDLKGNYIIVCRTLREAGFLFDRLCRYCSDKRLNFKCIKRIPSEIIIFEQQAKIRFIPEVRLYEATRGWHGKSIYSCPIEKLLDEYDREQAEFDFNDAMWEMR